jgi:hypothetical protein
MGCDIHALIERKEVHRNRDGEVYRVEWINSGDPDIGRNYELFAVLAGVRNYTGVTPICEPKGIPAFVKFETYSDGERWVRWDRERIDEKPCREFERLMEAYGEDGHSGSWLTLAEIKAYNIAQTVDDPHLIVGRDPKTSEVTMTAMATTGPHDGRVGLRRVLTWPGDDQPHSWLRLIRYMEQAKWDGQDDEGVRLVFFFDN